MTDLHILCVGKLKERFYLDAAAEYQKRLGGYCNLHLTELPEEKLPPDPARAQVEAALRREGEALRAKTPPGSHTVALCIEGKPFSSPDVARLLAGFDQSAAKHLVFYIGGSYGLDSALKAGCQTRMSMSPMTFPHHLARVMLLEQLYRGFKINEGSTYHK